MQSAGEGESTVIVMTTRVRRLHMCLRLQRDPLLGSGVLGSHTARSVEAVSLAAGSCQTRSPHVGSGSNGTVCRGCEQAAGVVERGMQQRTLHARCSRHLHHQWLRQ